MSQAALALSLSEMLSLIAQERLAMEANNAELIHALAAKKSALCSRIETGLSNPAALAALPASELARVRELASSMEREAKINANIASCALAMSLAKLNLIAQLASDSYGPDGKPQGPAGRGSWRADA